MNAKVTVSDHDVGDEMKNQQMSTNDSEELSSVDQVINSQDVNQNSIESRLGVVEEGGMALNSLHSDERTRCGDVMDTLTTRIVTENAEQDVRKDRIDIRAVVKQTKDMQECMRVVLCLSLIHI